MLSKGEKLYWEDEKENLKRLINEYGYLKTMKWYNNPYCTGTKMTESLLKDERQSNLIRKEARKENLKRLLSFLRRCYRWN